MIAGFRAGVATVDIAPKPGLPWMGNNRDDHDARRAHDRPYAKAMAFVESSTKQVHGTR